MPGALAPDPVPVDTDPLHCFSSPRSATHSGGPMAAARPWWPGSWGNDKDCRPRGASPEGAGRVEYRCAAIGHPKVLPGRLGRCQGIRPRSRARATAWVRLAAPSLPRTWATCVLTVSSAPPGRGRCAGWTCPLRAAAAPPAHGRSAARPGPAAPRCLPGRRRARARLTAQPRGSPAAPAPPVTAGCLSLAAGDDRFWRPLADLALPVGARSAAR
jgi:hypothetical protein